MKHVGKLPKFLHLSVEQLCHVSFQIVFMVTDAGKKKVDPRPRQSNDIFMGQPSRKLKHKSSSRLPENI